MLPQCAHLGGARLVDAASAIHLLLRMLCDADAVLQAGQRGRCDGSASDRRLATVAAKAAPHLLVELLLGGDYCRDLLGAIWGSAHH